MGEKNYSTQVWSPFWWRSQEQKCLTALKLIRKLDQYSGHWSLVPGSLSCFVSRILTGVRCLLTCTPQGVFCASLCWHAELHSDFKPLQQHNMNHFYNIPSKCENQRRSYMSISGVTAQSHPTISCSLWFKYGKAFRSCKWKHHMGIL